MFAALESDGWAAARRPDLVPTTSRPQTHTHPPAPPLTAHRTTPLWNPETLSFFIVLDGCHARAMLGPPQRERHAPPFHPETHTPAHPSALRPPPDPPVEQHPVCGVLVARITSSVFFDRLRRRLAWRCSSTTLCTTRHGWETVPGSPPWETMRGPPTSPELNLPLDHPVLVGSACSLTPARPCVAPLAQHDNEELSAVVRHTVACHAVVSPPLSSPRPLHNERCLRLVRPSKPSLPRPGCRCRPPLPSSAPPPFKSTTTASF